jgi:DNA-binding Lrp family transcriptional regulator
MVPLKLSVLERHILYLVLMDAKASVTEVARRLGCRDHHVRYALLKFRDSGVISRRMMIDVFRLGFSRHAYYVSLSSEGQKRREEIVEFLVRDPCTTVVLEVGGEYDLFVAIVARSSVALSQFGQSLSQKFGGLFSRKDVAVTVRHSVFGEKLLVDDEKLFMESFYEATAEHVEVDDLDDRLLSALSLSSTGASSSLARSLGVPVSTVDYRMKRLLNDGVICGDMHEIRGELIGLTNYLVLVGMKGVSKELEMRFHAFARRHPNIPHLSYEVGHWDFMMGVAVTNQSDLNNLVERIRVEFGESLATVKSFSMFRARKVRDYPVISPSPGVLRRSVNA